MRIPWIIGGVLAITAIAALVWFLWSRPAVIPMQPSGLSPGVLEEPPASAAISAPVWEKQVRARDIDGADDAFVFSVKIPAIWQAEAVAGVQAISFYDPTAQGDTTLDQSQIFVRSFRANDFLTLTTVDIHSRDELTINGRSAVSYDIQKKAGVADFPAQPAWRNQRHVVTDIRVSDTKPSVFYVIAKRPSLNMEIYESFLRSLQVDDTKMPVQSIETSSLVEPVDQFQARVIKKPFGIHITPETSPVQPERFSGYHTGADAEYEDVFGDVPVRAAADGTVLLASISNGYGGVVAIQHVVADQQVVGIYGHLRPSSLLEAGSIVSAGQQIGVLGTGGTVETDGERKHLHFGLVKGTVADLRGYTTSESELSGWLNPLF